MRVEIVMPKLSDAMTEGTVTAWFKTEGEAVKAGEAIAELETEKSTVDLEAPASGVLARIVVVGGSAAVAVGTVLAEIETDASAVVAAPVVETPAESAVAVATIPARENTVVATIPAREITVVARASSASDASVPATPLARRMAAQSGLDLASLSRSGIGGKVCKADVEAALGGVGGDAATRIGDAAAASGGAVPRQTSVSPIRGVPNPRTVGAAAGPGLVPLSRVRRTVADRMSKSKATIPHFYLSSDCRVDRLLEVRERLKADGIAVSVNDFVVRAAALALVRFPEANASWADGSVQRHDRIDIAVAVALDDGLVTPVLRAADTLGLGAISEGVRELAGRAREGKLAPHEYDGGTFTISNLGMFGVGEMFAIVNPPQACILGVGAAEPRPVVEEGKVVAGTTMTLSISADHRVLDGASGARLLAEIRRLLEEPARMLV